MVIEIRKERREMNGRYTPTPISHTKGVIKILNEAKKITSNYPYIKKVHLSKEQFQMLHDSIRIDLKPDYEHSIPWEGIEFVKIEES